VAGATPSPALLLEIRENESNKPIKQWTDQGTKFTFIETDINLWSLRRADLSSRGVVPKVCACVTECD
jgi:hypothetical protein